MLPKMPIRLAFNPVQHEDAKLLWEMNAGRLLALLWRPLHLCGERWWFTARSIAQSIERRLPTNANDLFDCFKGYIDGIDFIEHDCREFCNEAHEYFYGRRGLRYVIAGEHYIVFMGEGTTPLGKVAVDFEKLRRLSETCCGNCDYFEDDGDLRSHCDACCRTIVSELWRMTHGVREATHA